MVVGVPLIGPQLLIAILTVLFFHHNKCLEGERHICNAEVVPIAHPPLHSTSQTDNVTQDVSNVFEVISSSDNENSEATTILNSVLDNIKIQVYVRSL